VRWVVEVAQSRATSNRNISNATMTDASRGVRPGILGVSVDA
jgi:hypothetical protein